MSRFFKGSDSESESESSGEEAIVQKPAAVSKNVFQFSDDEEETKRVVRSAKDKRYDEMRDVIKLMKNHKKIKDMAKVLSDFEALTKGFDKAKKIVEKEGMPRFYIRTLAELDDFVAEVWEDREGRKAMGKLNAKGLTALRQKLRKYNRDFEKDIEDYKAKPDEGESGDDDEEDKDEDASDSDSDDDVKDDTDFRTADFLKDEKKPLKDLSDDQEDDDDSEGWTSSSDDDSSSTDETEYDPANLAAMFLKKVPGEGSKAKEEKKKEKEKEKEEKKKEKAKKMEEEEDDKDGGEWETVKGGVPTSKEKPKMFAKDTEITIEVVIKKFNEILSVRGKKSTDRSEQVQMLTELLSIAQSHNLGQGVYIKIMIGIMSGIYDSTPSIASCMKNELWDSALEFMRKLLSFLHDNLEIQINENILEESEEVKTTPYRIRGCINTLVERFDEEFTKMLQACDAHSTEYVDRLKDEKGVFDIILSLQDYLEKRSSTTADEMCRCYLRIVEHMYYKMDYSIIEEEKQDEETPESIMDRLCKYVYTKDSVDRLRTRAMLCQIYHHALHGRWYKARDLMLMSHLQDNIHHADIPLQILYNRTVVQLGLCAFRNGMIKDAHNCLVDIQSGGRAKELLAQGLLLQKQHERTPEQEKIEKRRQMPYHMHINLELLECVYLVSAMLMEIPYMAAHEFDARRRMISKNFHYVMRMSDRQTLTGPPESMREHVVAASKAMKLGDWKKCKNYIINDKMNTKVWNLFHEQDIIRDLINSKIREESLRTYLFTYSSVYDSLCMVTLANMFELEQTVVHSVLSKMIINEELMASLDEPTQTVVMHRTEPSRLQALALQLSDKVGSLVDYNEKIMEMKQGNFFTFQKGGQQKQGEQRGGYQQRDGQQQNWNRRNNPRQQRNY